MLVAVDIGSTWTRGAVDLEGSSLLLRFDGDGGPSSRALRSAVTANPVGQLGTFVETEATLSGAPSVVDDVVLRLGDPTPIHLGMLQVQPSELYSVLLGRVVKAAADLRNDPVMNVAILVPPVWGQYRKERVLEAAAAAGVPQARLLSSAEVVAAHHVRATDLSDTALIGVYDLGGRSFTFSIVQRKGSDFTIVGRPDGVERLGGDDLDLALWRHLDAKLMGAASASASPADRRQVLNRLRETREQLSKLDSVTVELPLNGETYKETLSRDELEVLSGPLLQVTVDVIRRTLASADLRAHDLASLVLVGGTTEMSGLPALLNDRLGCRVERSDRPGERNVISAAEWLLAEQNNKRASGKTESQRLQSTPSMSELFVLPSASPNKRGTSGRTLNKRTVAGTTLIACVGIFTVATAVSQANDPATFGRSADEAVPPSSTFAISFENSDQQVTPNVRLGLSAVFQFCCATGGLETARGTDEIETTTPMQPHSGEGMLLYSGKADAPEPSWAVNTVLNLPSGRIVQEETTLSWWMWPEPGAGWLSTSLTLDLRFVDGTFLYDLNPLQINGAGAGVSDLASELRVGEWQRVSLDVGAVATGKEVESLVLRFDSGLQNGLFRGFIDDVEVSD